MVQIQPLGPPGPLSALLSPFLGEGSFIKIDYTKKGSLIRSPLLEDLDQGPQVVLLISIVPVGSMLGTPKTGTLGKWCL